MQGSGVWISRAQRRVCRRFGVDRSPPGRGSMIGFALSRGPDVRPAPELVPYLALPPGWSVVLAAD
jgi:hypothetical protein